MIDQIKAKMTEISDCFDQMHLLGLRSLTLGAELEQLTAKSGLSDAQLETLADSAEFKRMKHSTEAIEAFWKGKQ